MRTGSLFVLSFVAGLSAFSVRAQEPLMGTLADNPQRCTLGCLTVKGPAGDPMPLHEELSAEETDDTARPKTAPARRVRQIAASPKGSARIEKPRQTAQTPSATRPTVHASAPGKSKVAKAPVPPNRDRLWEHHASVPGLITRRSVAKSRPALDAVRQEQAGAMAPEPVQLRAEPSDLEIRLQPTDWERRAMGQSKKPSAIGPYGALAK